MKTTTESHRRRGGLVKCSGLTQNYISLYRVVWLTPMYSSSARHGSSLHNNGNNLVFNSIQLHGFIFPNQKTGERNRETHTRAPSAISISENKHREKGARMRTHVYKDLICLLPVCHSLEGADTNSRGVRPRTKSSGHAATQHTRNRKTPMQRNQQTTLRLLAR